MKYFSMSHWRDIIKDSKEHRGSRNSQHLPSLFQQHCYKSSCPPGDPRLNTLLLHRTDSAAFLLFDILSNSVSHTLRESRTQKKSKSCHVWGSLEMKEKRERKRSENIKGWREKRWKVVEWSEEEHFVRAKKSISVWESTERGWSSAWFKLISTAIDLAVWPYTRVSHSHRLRGSSDR